MSLDEALTESSDVAQVQVFKDILLKVISEGKTNMCRNQIIDKINTAYDVFRLTR